MVVEPEEASVGKKWILQGRKSKKKDPCAQTMTPQQEEMPIPRAELAISSTRNKNEVRHQEESLFLSGSWQRPTAVILGPRHYSQQRGHQDCMLLLGPLQCQASHQECGCNCSLKAAWLLWDTPSCGHLHHSSTTNSYAALSHRPTVVPPQSRQRREAQCCWPTTRHTLRIITAQTRFINRDPSVRNHGHASKIGAVEPERGASSGRVAHHRLPRIRE